MGTLEPTDPRDFEEHPTTLEAEFGEDFESELIDLAKAGPEPAVATVYVSKCELFTQVRILLDTPRGERLGQVDLSVYSEAPETLVWSGLWIEPGFQDDGWLSHLGSVLPPYAEKKFGVNRLVVSTATEALKPRLYLTGLEDDLDGNLSASLVEGRMPEYFDYKAGRILEPEWRKDLPSEQVSQHT